MIGAHVARNQSPCSASYELSGFVWAENNLYTRLCFLNQDTANQLPVHDNDFFLVIFLSLDAY